MEKVASYYPSSQVYPATTSQFPGMTDRGSIVRGHHSSINKAVEAHRQMVEERQSRNVHRDSAMLSVQNPNNEDVMIAQQNGANASGDYNSYENTLIEAPSTQAKMANIQTFQSLEPDRPTLGEPVPKGSYIDVEV